MIARLARVLLIAAALASVSAGRIHAQVVGGSISGYVLDPGRKAVAGAEVRIQDPTRSFERRTATDAAGFFRFAELPPGTYTLTASSAGFSDATAHEIALPVDGRLRLELLLALGGISHSLTVTGSVETVDHESAEMSAVLDRRKIDRLPLNRRDFLQLALLVPGVASPVEDSELSSRGSFAMHANGGREEYNNFLLDGVDNNDPYVNRYVIQPPVDSIQEFRVATSSYSAEYGRSAAGQVNVVTRRGSNHHSGFLYEYLRNRALDARNFFDASEKPCFIRSQFGFGLGGPIARDRAFYFANADFLRERRGISRLASVPTAAMRRGDLSELKAAIVDPFTRQPFPGGTIPDGRIHPVARKVLDLFPLPNRPGLAGNHLPDAVLRDEQSMANIRWDQFLTRSDEIAIRYTYGRTSLFEPFADAEDIAALPGFGDTVDDGAHNAMIHYQRFIGPRLINSFRLGFARLSRNLLPENHDRNVGQEWALGWLDLPARSFGYPVFNIAGFSRVGDAPGLPIVRVSDTWHIQDGLTLDRGRHLLKLGGEVRRMGLDSRVDLLVRGSLSFSGAISGSGISDLLMGFPSFGLQAKADNPMTLRTTAVNGYLHDDWRFARNLTVNLGIRYEYNTPPVDPQDRMFTLDSAAGKVLQVGTGGLSRSGVGPDRNNFAPRIGLAWNPANDFVLKAGYGVYYDSGMFIAHTAQYFNPPQFLLRVFFPGPAGLLTLTDPFPSQGGLSPPPALSALNPDLVASVMHHWNLGLVNAIASLGTLGVAYAGSKGTHLIRSRDLNQPAPGPGLVQPRRPLPSFGSIFYAESGGNSSYHSLQGTFSRTMAKRLSLWALYTFSKSIDDTSAFLDTRSDRNFPQDSRNYRAERGLSSFDIRNRIAVTWIYSLPQGNRWTRDTEMRGITILQTGQPFTTALRFDNSNTGNNGGTTGTDRPDLLRDPKLGHRTADRWFDAEAFAVAPRYSFGNAGRNILEGPGFVVFDLSLARRFRISDGGTLSIEAQAFNLFNRANFNLPEFYADEPATFGRIFSAKAPRQLQFSLRFSF
ncbi:MAG: TonB-dependent receptor [Acidobacteria bacterium]|nr:TonB-dependent receptor [Acidobacteriota bacterium]